MNFIKRLFVGHSSTDRPKSVSLHEKDAPSPSETSQGHDSTEGALAEMLKNPRFIPDPVFPKEGYLEVFGRIAFRQLLENFDDARIIEHVQLMSADSQIVMLTADAVGFWVIDLAVASNRGVSGRDEFISRVKEPIRRPPPEMAAFTAEQHILAKGVSRIQIQDEASVPGQYQICQLKVVGWYMAVLVSPANRDSVSG